MQYTTVPITNTVKISITVADILAVPIIGTPLNIGGEIYSFFYLKCYYISSRFYSMALIKTAVYTINSGC